MTRRLVSRVPRSVWLRFLLLLLLIAGAIVALRFSPVAEWLTRDRILGSLEAFGDHPAAPFVFYGVFTLGCLFGSPIVPLVVAGGAAFGVLEGAGLSLAAVLSGASLNWFLARKLGYAFVLELVGDRLKRVERLITRRGFWSLVRLRFVPIPYFITNTAITLVGTPFPLYLASTTVAMVPVMLVWSAFASALVETAEGVQATAIRNLVVILVVLVTLSFLPPRIAAWRRARRLESLRELRRRRTAS